MKESVEKTPWILVGKDCAEHSFSDELLASLTQLGVQTACVQQTPELIGHAICVHHPVITLLNFERCEEALADFMLLLDRKETRFIVIMQNTDSLLTDLLRRKNVICAKASLRVHCFTDTILQLTQQMLAEYAESGSDADFLESIVTRSLHMFSIPVHLRGFHYLRTALCYILSLKKFRYGMMKEIYPHVAEEYGVSAASVERNIRTAISRIPDSESTRLALDYFGYPPIEAQYMQNTEFIAMIEDKMRRIVERNHAQH